MNPDRQPPGRAPSVSVIICAYADERWSELEAAVASMAAQQLPPAETIVVVDHNPRLLERVRQKLPHVIAAENDEPRGLSGARNSGLRVATGDVVAFLDDDAIAAPDWLAWLLPGYQDASVIGVGGAIAPRWSSKRPDWFPEEFDWVVGCTYRGMPEQPAAVRNLIGANMSFRRELFEHVGGFRSGIGRVGTLPVGCEETEFCVRALQLLPGRRFLFEPRARVTHRVPADRATWRYFRRRCLAEGRSKALVSRYVGAADGLASERAYTLRTLPVGVARSLAAVARHGQAAGVAQASAIVAGVTITTAGYVTGRLLSSRSSTSPAARAIGARPPLTSPVALAVAYGHDDLQAGVAPRGRARPAARADGG